MLYIYASFFAPLGSRKENGTTRLLADVPFFSPPKMIIIARKAVTVGGSLTLSFFRSRLSLSLSLHVYPYKSVALFLSPSYNILRLIITRRCMNHLVRSVIVAMLLYCYGDGNDDAADDDDDAGDSYDADDDYKRIYIGSRRGVLLSLEEGCREMEITNAQRGRAVTKAVWKFHNNILTPILPPEIPCILSYRLHLYIIIVYFVYIYIYVWMCCAGSLYWRPERIGDGDFFHIFFLIWYKKKRVKTELNIILFWRTRSYCVYIIILLYR